MLGGVLVVLGLILVVFIGFRNIGSFAEICKVFFLGTLGKSAYSFPILLMIVGTYCIMSEKKVKPLAEIRKGLIIIALIAATLTVFTEPSVTIYSNPVKTVVDSINAGIASGNFGGAVGTILGGALAGLIGIVPARIIFPVLTFVLTLFLCNISFKQFFGAISYAVDYSIDHLNQMINTLFRDDEVKKYEYTDNFGDKVPKLSRREKAKIEKEQERLEKLREPGSSNVDANLNIDKTEQVEFDFNKLGGKPSEEEIKGKQKRDEFFKLQKEEKEDKSVKEVLTLDHTAHVEDDNYEYPSIELLAEPKEGEVFDRKAIHGVAVKLQKTLASFGVDARVTNITKGPTVTRYELTPSTGVKVSKIVNLSDDIALSLAAKSIRIEAPIPGKSAVGIEVPNTVTESVMLREVIESDTFKNHKSKLAYALGKDAAGEVRVGDIAKMPHMLIAGATGSGKSVCINSIIVSLLYKSKPSEVKMILVDPKMVELSGYNGIPHLLIPVVTDPKKAAGALNWAVQEMVNRYNLFASKGVKDIKGYNAVMEKDEEGVKLPQIVIIIDELADLMMVAPNDVEDAICRLAQMARAAGMHLIIATQRPSVDVITGIIKANIPSRIAFTVSSQVDSRTILDMAGAEKLLGKGDMLYYPVGETKPLRMQGTFVSESEIESIVEEIKSNSNVKYSNEIIESIEKANGKNSKAGDDEEQDDADELLNDAIDLVMDMGQASASMLQRRFKIGYSRAGRIVDQMEARGLISGYDGSKPRQVLISKEEWQELKMGNGASAQQDEDTAQDTTSQNNADSFVGEEQKRSKIDIEL
ncbi:MAG: DNA translocase FtsK 4TM domain-containing protein [Clostridia bacterium]|nr:DNA translocase FtsK 4TM domain-containing protein [Clostridia bacterium]